MAFSVSFLFVSERRAPHKDCQASCLFPLDVKRRDYTFGLDNQDSVLSEAGAGLPHLRLLVSVCGCRGGALAGSTRVLLEHQGLLHFLALKFCSSLSSPSAIRATPPFEYFIIISWSQR